MSEPQPDLQTILDSPSYELAERDVELLARRELRPVRVQLELLKPELAFHEHDIGSTIVVFGSTQIAERGVLERRLAVAKSALAAAPDNAQAVREVSRSRRLLAKASYYDAARQFAHLVSTQSRQDGGRYVVVTGGGPGIMEAANRGAYDAGAKSIGLNIALGAEQIPNAYMTPELCFRFHYFALRKLHFLLRAAALVVFPGGFGTIDELSDTLTLRQTRRMQEIPIIMFGRAYWEQVLDFQFLADEGMIDDVHLDLIKYVETPEEAWSTIAAFHRHES